MHPVSFAQRRLWFLSRMPETGPAYNCPLTTRLTGRLDWVALAAALDDVAARHDVLRTVYPEVDGEPVQRVLDQTPDLRIVTTTEEALPAALADEAAHVFDLTAELPVRARLFALGSDEFVLSLVIHHIATDGWSWGPLLRDLARAYEARRTGRAPRFAPLPVQYADYAAWQRESLGDEDAPDSALSRQLAYWREALAGLPAELTLPHDRPRPAVASLVGGSVPVDLDAALHARLAEVAQAHGCTLFMALQAGLAALLSKLGAGTDIPLGTVVAGRDDEALNGLVGFFVNTLVLRTDLSGDPTFAELLDRVRESDLEAYDHQDVPFERVVEALNPERSLARHPLFQVMMTLESGAGPAFDLPGVHCAEQQVTWDIAKFDLTVDFHERRDADGAPAGITGALEYATDLFDRETATGIAAALTRVLNRLAADPARPVSHADALSAEQRHQVLTAWNDTAAPVPEQTLPELFEAQAARTPDATALVFQDTALSYAALDARANALAHRLAALGVGADDLVALALPRSAASVTALLAVLKAGAAFVPVDTDYPAERIAKLLATATTVVTDSATAPMLPATAPPRILVDTDSDASAETGGLGRAIHPRHAAYVIHTSGSTGEPKGVVIDHAGLRNLYALHRAGVISRAEELNGGRRMRVALTAALSFDTSWEGLLWMVAGHELHLVDDDTRRDATALVRHISTTGIDVLDVTPTYAEQLVEEGLLDGHARDPLDGSGHRLDGPGHRPSVLLLGGEAAGRALWTRVRATEGLLCRNLYGPTECSVDALRWDAADSEEPLVGRPVANTRAYVLDAGLRPVGPGVAGELYLTGPGLARGYLDRPALTAARFVACPYEPGARMYRTGDLVRRDRHGRLEYLGRADDQVKIRGFRVEPGEVEAALRTSPQVAQAAVVAREDGPGGKRLVAYVVPAAHRTAEAAALRDHLAERLPDHMVPSAFVSLKALPMNRNGKLDQSALPAPDYGPATTSRAPRGPREELIAGLFAEVLGLPAVGVDDSFFALGGHSLLASRLISRVRAALGVELGIRDLFQHPTVAALARGHRPARTGPAPTARERPAVLPLSSAQRRIWFLSRLGQGTDYNCPFAVRLRGPLDLSALRAALADVVARHEALRTVYPEADGEPYQRVLPTAAPALDVQDLTGRAPNATAAALAALAVGEFDLGRDLPVRATALRLAADEHVLSLVVHHIATDGWSWGVLLRDLSTAYAARLAGAAPDFPPLPVQYADYALWQDDLLGDAEDPGSRAARQLAFWRERLADAPAELELPYDRPRPPVASNAGGFLPLDLDRPLHARLAQVARDHGCTLFMVLQTALAALLSRLGAGTDIVLGTPVAGRPDEALGDTVGLFVNTLVLRTDLSGDPTFAELLTRVRESDLEAYDHQDVPFERVVEAVNPERSLGRHPLFQVMIQLDESGDGLLELPEVTAAEEPVPFDVSKFDLRLDLTDRRDTTGAPAGLTGGLEYATDLFDPATVDLLGDRLRRVLEQLAADPERRVGAVDLLSERERHQLVEGWNDTAVDVPAPCVPELFESYADRAPEAVAVLAGDAAPPHGEPADQPPHDLTYRDLNERANRLARHLIERGAGPEHLVAVALPRTPDLVVTLLAVLKSGAGYLPLDPAQPADRLATVLGAAAPVLTVTTSALADRLPGRPLLVLDAPEARTAVARHGGGNLTQEERTSPLTPATPAYVIYTSGSTGEPKGVVIEHRSLALYLAWARQAYPAMGGRALVHSPVAFDLTVTGLWGPLTSGGSVRLVALDDREDGPAPVAKPTFVKATPSHLALFGVLPEEYAPSGQLVLGGELLLGSVLDEWRARHPDVRVVNEYGPTETTVGCGEFRIEPGAPLPSGGVTIGRPVWNTQWYVLDAALAPAPTGVVGELYIGGGLLARGYLGKPGLTAGRFVANPFGAPGTRMYRTGDLVRRRPDGQLEFTGRVDDQVKVRGFRVELGEIEALIAAQPGITGAAVTVRDGSRLAAYLVGRDGERPDVAAVRDRLGGVLPEYMVPSAYVVLDRLPLTKNGKLDRRALPAPDLPAPGEGRGPRTAQEKALCELFAETLGLPRVGAEDSFFALGGHSLLAARLVSRARTSLGVDLRIQDVFDAPTVAALAAGLQPGAGPAAPTGLLPLRAAGRSAPLFAVHPGAGIGWVYTALLDHLDAEQPLYALQSRALRNDELPKSVDDMAADYVEQIRAVQPTGPYHLLGWSFGAVVAHAMAVHLRGLGEEVALLAMLDGYPPDDTAPADPDGADGLAELLLSLGHELPDRAGRPLEIPDFVRLARTGDGPLAGLDDDLIRTLGRAFVGHAALGREHVPATYDGDVVFFSAALDPEPGSAEPWRPYVTGRLEHHAVACVHGDMLRAGPSARIGAVLARELRAKRP
ncbi:amino acid adenylation domain-containing protein [Streptomyces sp. G45]|uniref:amino acid adenylation domain-containing protein n=1 Tax=Streptomyces sp. G45 TaxID=3406627 RepID=UPI003C1B76AD